MNKKLWVACDANGTCHGIYLNEKDADVVAGYIGAYTSSHLIHETLPLNYKELDFEYKQLSEIK